MPDLVSELLPGNGQHAEDSNLSRVQTPVIGPENFQSGIEPVKDTARVSLSHGVKWRLRGPRLRENVLLKLYSPPRSGGVSQRTVGPGYGESPSGKPNSPRSSSRSRCKLSQILRRASSIFAVSRSQIASACSTAFSIAL